MPPKKKPSILILDRDVSLAHILAERFRAEGWTTRVAKTIEHAKKFLARKASDVLLVDPEHEADAQSALSAWMTSASDGVTYVIIHTATLTREAQMFWKRSGASGILKKGERSLTDLVKKVKKYGTHTT